MFTIIRRKRCWDVVFFEPIVSSVQSRIYSLRIIRNVLDVRKQQLILTIVKLNCIIETLCKHNCPSLKI